jgi:hypothetical protein
MASGEAEGKRGRSFWTTLPGILTGVAGLITAVVSLIAVFGPDDNGPDEPRRGDRAELRAYQQRVVPICDQDREQQIRFEREEKRLEQQAQIVGQQFRAGDPGPLQLYLDSVFDLLDKAVEEQAALKGELEALEPPEELQGTHDEAVALWGRLVTSARSATGQMSDARDDFLTTGDPTVLTEAESAVDDSELDALGDQVDVQLRRLGGSGCDPAP